MPIDFTAGDIFGIPLPDGSMAAGQVLACERRALNSVGCAFFPGRVSASGALTLSNPIAVLLVTPDLLSKGLWPVLGRGDVHVPPEDRPYERFRNAGWVGAKILGSANAAEFMAAYHGLVPWDAWGDREYLDKLLLPGILRPEHVVLSKAG